MPALKPKQSKDRVRAYDQKRHKLTVLEYGGLQRAFDHLNRLLFGGMLPDVFIVYSRRVRSGGHYAPKRYSGRGGREMDRDEIALNPDHFMGRTDEWVVSVLLHEMVHHWQEHFGKSRRENYGYHDREFSARMKSLGLMPSNTGAVGGKETGQRMSHYVIAGGAFAQALAALAAGGWQLYLESAPHAGGSEAPKKKNKATYVCPVCDQTAWGKPTLAIKCESCDVRMVPESATAATPAPSHDPMAPERVVFRGYEIDEVGDDWIIRKDGVEVSVQPNKDAALTWVLLEIAAEDEPSPEPKRPRGRPKGSKNKPKEIVRSYDEQNAQGM